MDDSRYSRAQLAALITDAINDALDDGIETTALSNAWWIAKTNERKQKLVQQILEIVSDGNNQRSD